MTLALVTGASVGIGAAFCRELARTGHDLIVVSRTEADLKTLAAQLRSAHGHQVEVLVADLATPEGLERVRARVGEVDLLVNNAGMGARGALVDAPVERELLALDVMARAVLVLSHAAAQGMRQRGRGAIINVSSVAGFTAIAHYCAIKAYVTTLSEVLAGELSGTGVRVLALCPGFTRTEFHQRAGLEMAGLPAALWLDADELVRQALADVRRGSVISVPSALYKAAVLAARLAPRPLLRAVSRRIGRARADR